MSYANLVERAWRIAWRYRALWLFGLFLAIFGGGAGGAPSFSGNLADFSRAWGERAAPWPGGLPLVGLAALLFGAAAIALAVGLAGMLLRYLSETALIRMVDRYEEQGQEASVAEGFRLGWSRPALELFLIDLVIGLPVALVLGFLFAISLAPLFLWATENRALGILGTLATLAALFVTIVLALLVTLTLSVLKPFIRRACVLGRRGIFGSIASGARLAWRRLGNALGIWLIALGIRIAYGLAALLAAIVLGAIALPMALFFGGGAALLARLVLNSAPMAMMLGGLVAAPVFFVIIVLPLLFLGALFQTLLSTIWTLAYRQLRESAGL
jgi:hypothetical protein